MYKRKLSLRTRIALWWKMAALVTIALQPKECNQDLGSQGGDSGHWSSTEADQKP